MKWCLSGRQSPEYIKKADELMVLWYQKGRIFDLIEMNPKARIILSLVNLKEELKDKDYDWIRQERTLCKNDLAVITANGTQVQKCIENNIPWIPMTPCNTFESLNYFRALGASDVYITGELCHCLDDVEEYYDELKIRVCMNDCGMLLIPQSKYLNGICGPWFRPEDVEDLYQIDVGEFCTNILDEHTDILRQEQALYRIYAERHQWDGRLEEIIYNLPYEGVINGILDKSFQTRRSNCRMKCMINGRCSHCYTVARMAHEDMVESIRQLRDNEERERWAAVMKQVEEKNKQTKEN